MKELLVHRKDHPHIRGFWRNDHVSMTLHYMHLQLELLGLGFPGGMIL